MKNGLLIFSLIVLMLLPLMLPAMPKKANADQSTFDVALEFEEFVSNNKNRAAFSDGEKEAAQYLKQRLEDFGYQATTSEFAIDSKISQNVQAVYEATGTNSQKHRVVVGAHYDAATVNQGGCEGAYDNGTGVTALLYLAALLQTHSPALDFDVEIVFFGAEEPGILGSSNYLSQLNITEKSQILLMISFEMVGGGDYLYLYCDETKTIAQDYIFEKSQSVNIQGQELRQFPTVYPKILGGGYGSLSYNHNGLMSDHAAFYDEGIPIAAFLGLNLETSKVGLVESKDKKAIAGTADDNYDNFVELYPDYAKKIEFTARTAFESIIGADFVEQMQLSKSSKNDVSFFTNSLYAGLIKIALIVVLIVGIVFFARYLNKKYPPRPVVVNMVKFSDPFEQPPQNTSKPDDPFEGY